MFQLWFSAAPPRDYREAHAIAQASPFFAAHVNLRANGILTQPPQEGLFLSSGAHTDDDIDRTLEAAGDAMRAAAEALRRGDVGPKGGLR